MKPFWISWYGSGAFEYHGPWWVSGYRDETAMFCAAVMATDDEHAKSLIREAHDDKADQEWRFATPRAPDWSPFCDRFQRADWMRWPWPTEKSSG